MNFTKPFYYTCILRYNKEREEKNKKTHRIQNTIMVSKVQPTDRIILPYSFIPKPKGSTFNWFIAKMGWLFLKMQSSMFGNKIKKIKHFKSNCLDNIRNKNDLKSKSSKYQTINNSPNKRIIIYLYHAYV